MNFLFQLHFCFQYITSLKYFVSCFYFFYYYCEALCRTFLGANRQLHPTLQIITDLQFLCNIQVTRLPGTIDLVACRGQGEESHANTGRTCKLYIESPGLSYMGIEPGTEAQWCKVLTSCCKVTMLTAKSLYHAACDTL